MWNADEVDLYLQRHTFSLERYPQNRVAVFVAAVTGMNGLVSENMTHVLVENIKGCNKPT